MERMIDDPNAIKSLFGQNNAWEISVGGSMGAEKIETYFEADGSRWFAVYKDEKIDQRINSSYVERIIYIREDARNERSEEKLDRIKAWIEAYPLHVFPEPDFERAHQVLQQHGMSLDAISASNMRHVLTGVKKIIED